MKYPTWLKLREDLWVSEEGTEGIPDFIVARAKRQRFWQVSWRTSAHWAGQRYGSAREAMRDIEIQMEQKARLH
jgi:hypothetical protein